MKALFRAVAFPLVIFTVIIACLRLDSVLGWRGVRMPELGVPLALVGLLIVLWTNGLFLTRGGGTAHPFAAKTQQLVMVGPYRYVRNPMIWGAGSLLIGSALWLGSAGLWAAFAIFLTFVSLFVPFYEEHDMERRFGEAYRDYCRRVPRWLPRWPR